MGAQRHGGGIRGTRVAAASTCAPSSTQVEGCAGVGGPMHWVSHFTPNLSPYWLLLSLPRPASRPQDGRHNHIICLSSNWSSFPTCSCAFGHEPLFQLILQQTSRQLSNMCPLSPLSSTAAARSGVNRYMIALLLQFILRYNKLEAIQVCWRAHYYLGPMLLLLKVAVLRVCRCAVRIDNTGVLACCLQGGWLGCPAAPSQPAGALSLEFPPATLNRIWP